METAIPLTIDLTYLHSVTGGDAHFEKMLLTNAVTDIQDNMDLLKEAWTTGNAPALGNAAHTLKSVVVIAGMSPLEQLCKRVNVLFKDGIFRSEEENTVKKILNTWKEAKPRLVRVIDSYNSQVA